MSDDEDRTCYVCNFTPEVTSDLLEELFTQVGPVEKVTLADKNSYRFAMITFEDEESVMFAVETLDGIKLFNNPLTVKPRNGSKHENEYKRTLSAKRRDSYGSAHSTPNSDSRKRDYQGRGVNYDDGYSMRSDHRSHSQHSSPLPPPPPPPPPPPRHSESYPSFKTRPLQSSEGYSTPKSSFTGRPGGDQRRTFPTKPSDNRVYEGDTNGYDRWRGGGSGGDSGNGRGRGSPYNYRDSRYSSRPSSGGGGGSGRGGGDYTRY